MRTAWHAGTQYSIQVSLDALVGTGLHSFYTELLAKWDERDENGLPKHSPFDIIEVLQQLVWKTCTSVSETFVHTSTPDSLQSYIQPPTLHITLAKDVRGEGGVVAKVIGDVSSGYPCETPRATQNNSHITNSYNWGTAPVLKQDLELGPTIHIVQASELIVTNKAAKAGPMQQVHTITGTQFKPRLDFKAPEFDREISVLGAIISCGLDRMLRVSPFKGLVLLDNGFVAGMLFEWLEGWPLAEYPELSNLSFHKLWQEQVEAIVKELHRHNIVWGDVNVHNIFIDANANASGGNCNIQYVDEELKETYKGDIQGLRRVFEEWLPVAGKP